MKEPGQERGANETVKGQDIEEAANVRGMDEQGTVRIRKKRTVKGRMKRWKKVVLGVVLSLVLVSVAGLFALDYAIDRMLREIVSVDDLLQVESEGADGAAASGANAADVSGGSPDGAGIGSGSDGGSAGNGAGGAGGGSGVLGGDTSVSSDDGQALAGTGAGGAGGAGAGASGNAGGGSVGNAGSAGGAGGGGTSGAGGGVNGSTGGSGAGNGSTGSAPGGTGGSADPLTYSAEITPEKAKAAESSISLKDKVKVVDVMMGSLSASDVRLLSELASGGLSVDEKLEAKRLIMQRMSAAEYDELIQIAAKLGMSEGKSYEETYEQTMRE